MMKLTLLDLGRKDYREVWVIQKKLVQEVISGTSGDTLILVEHHFFSKSFTEKHSVLPGRQRG